MSLPIIWAGQAVDDANLQDTVAGPWSRVVDVNLAGNTGRNYDNLQDAWNAASAGDSIFVKAGDYSGGLVVTTGAGNTKNGISLYGEVSDVYSAGGGPTFGSIIQIEDCDDLSLKNLTTHATSADGFSFSNLNRYEFHRLLSSSAGADGFEVDQMERGTWFKCTALNATGRGFVMHDGMLRNDFYGCQAEAAGGHGWSIGAFPASNTWSVHNNFVACAAFHCTNSGDGFALSLGSPASGAKGWQHVQLVACRSIGNQGDGFAFTNIGVANPQGIVVGDCNAYLNGSAGYRMATPPASWGGFAFGNNQQSGNTAGGYVGFPATLLPGYLGRGLAVPGTNG